MYKVMLVDDEKLILNGIRQIIDWEKLGLEVVAMATNGEEAIKAFKEEPVAIVITDINMPKVDGLTMIKEMKAIRENVKFIILSGHDEFKYAREAIKLEVEGYILKPIDEEELEKILEDTIKKLKVIDKHHSDFIDRHSKVLQFLRGEESTVYNPGLLNIRHDANYFTIASLVIEAAQEGDKISCCMKAIQEYNLNCFSKNDQLEIFYNMNHAIILMNSWENETEEEIKSYYHKMQGYIKGYAGVYAFLTIGEGVNHIQDLAKSYRLVKQYEKYVVIKGYESFIDVTQMAESAESYQILLDADRLYKYIIEGSEEKAQGYLEEVFNEVRKEGVTLENVYQIVIRLAMLLQEVTSDFKLEKKHNIRGVSELLGDIYTAHDFLILKNIFIQEISEMIHHINAREKRYTPVIEQVISYINENYREDMNLKTLAYKYNINTSYLGQIFLKEVGCSFSQYLTNIKNSKAKELILTTNMRINDIAKEIGYTDTSYFYRKFKKHYGVSPATLREIKKY